MHCFYQSFPEYPFCELLNYYFMVYGNQFNAKSSIDLCSPTMCQGLYCELEFHWRVRKSFVIQTFRLLNFDYLFSGLDIPWGWFIKCIFQLSMLSFFFLSKFSTDICIMVSGWIIQTTEFNTDHLIYCIILSPFESANFCINL